MPLTDYLTDNPLLGALAASAAGGAATYFGGKSAEKAAGDNQQRALSALTGSTPQSTSAFNAQGGLDTAYLPGSSGDILNQFDQTNAQDTTDRISGLSPTFNTSGEAQNFIQDDLNFERTQFDDTINKFIESQNRAAGGIGNTGTSATTVDAVSDAYKNLQLGANTSGLNLFNQQNTADNALIEQLRRNAMPLATPLGSNASSAVNAVTQTPQPAGIGVGEILAASGGNALQSIQARIDASESQARTDALIERLLGNQNPKVASFMPTNSSSFTIPS